MLGEEAEEVVQDGERGRKKGRGREGAKCKRANTDDKDDQTQKFQSINLPYRKDKQLTYNRTVVWQHTHIPPMT